jgi:hypothetical protein
MRGMNALFVVVTLASLTAITDPARALDVVRVRISEFAGNEPASISSVSHPGLFALNPSIAAASLTVITTPANDKVDLDPATWFVNLTPSPPEAVADRFELTVVPKFGSPIALDAIRFRTAARFATNPTALDLRWSRDGFSTSLATVDLAFPATLTVGTQTPASSLPTVFRWTASNALGDHGGGAAGLRDEDLVVLGGLCPANPIVICTAPDRSVLRLTGDANPTRQRLSWTWTGSGPNVPAFGDPTSGTTLALCVYDGSALAEEYVIGPDTSCKGKPCWRQTGSGFRYANPKGNAAGITSVKLSLSPARTKISMSGKGAGLDLPLPLAPTSDVTVQLRRSDAAGCWDAAFDAPADLNKPMRFRDTVR